MGRTLLCALLALVLGIGSQMSLAAPLVPLSIPAGFRNTAPATSPLGSNLAAVEDFRAEYPFINHFKMARPWFSGAAFTFGPDGRALARDAAGNVKSLLAGQVARSVIFTGFPADPGLSNKRFFIAYDGDGRLEFDNVTVISNVQGLNGSATIQMVPYAGPDTDQIVIVRLVRTNPSNPLRNLRMLPAGGICASNPLVTVTAMAACTKQDFRSFRTYHASIVFNPQFLANIRGYRSLRFMDWMRTNNSTQTAFTPRAQPGDQFWSTGRGVPLEVMIALSNLMDINPWFNIPHRATDAYVTAFATLLYQQLEAGRRASIEYSNEVWNPIFLQTSHATARGIALGLNRLDGQRDDFIGAIRYYSRRAKQVFSLFEPARLPNVTGASLGRIRRVMATQSANAFLTMEILNFEMGSSKVDAFAIAPYFGDTIVDADRRSALVAAGVDGVFDWLLNGNAVIGFGSLPTISADIQSQIGVVRMFRKPLISYEGGQHLLGGGDFQFDEELNALFDAVNRDPRMKTVYTRYLNDWRNRTGGEFTHYLNVDPVGPFGRWGAKEYQTQPRSAAPKFDAIQAYISARRL